jgi:predicted MFS family arabinose efflux permease
LRLGSAWQSLPGTYDYAAPVGSVANAAVSVAVSLPSHVVWRAAARSVKNFAALALASALLAALFFGVARALSDLSARSGPAGDPRALALARPIFFVAVFADSLSAGFLPQLLREAALVAGSGPQAASLAFTGYFIAFMLALLPATAWIGRIGARSMIVGGALLIALAGAAPAIFSDFHVLVLARIAAGLGQGALFVGVQAAVAGAAAPGQRTTVAAIMVFGFSGGMISGAAIGALLYQDIGASGVFAASATVGLLLAFYAARVVHQRAAAPTGSGLIGLLRAAPAALAGWRFGSGLLLVGAPSKAVMTGVVVFALPLMLYDRGWSADDIGQIVMLYGAGVLAISGPVARAVDRSQGVARDGRLALMAGGALSTMALLLIGAPQADALIGALTIAGGALLLGLAHGCVNAPVVTFAASGTGRAGPDGTGALYRVVERVGHVAGPGIAAAVILWAGTAGAGLMVLAAAIAACTGIFAIICGVKRS